MKNNVSDTEAELEQCSNKLTSAQDSELVSHWQELSLEDSSLGDCVNQTNTAAISSVVASPKSQYTPTCENSCLEQEMQTSLPPPHHANPLQLKASDWVAPIDEIASPPSCGKLEKVNQNSSVSKTCLDCYQPPLIPEPNPEHISNRCSKSFGPVGTMRNGLLSEQPNTIRSGRVKGFCLLPRPGALSWSGKGRPPGTTKSEAKAKKLGILQKNEVYNPEWLEIQFGLPVGWTSPQEHQAATELLATVEQHSETALTPESLRSPSKESSTLIDLFLKAISLWQPWASLIPLGLKHYETRSWKTNYRGKLLICSTAKSTKAQYQQYLKICNEVELPTWDETNFPHGQAIAICDLTDCIPMTPEFIAQQSQTEILCGDWQVGRYAWKLENIQPITESFAVKGKQGLFNIPLTNILSVSPSTQVSNDSEVLGGNPLLSISPSTQVQGDDQTESSSLLLSTPSNTQVSNDGEVLGGNLLHSIPYATEVSDNNQVLGENPLPSISPSTHRKHGEGSGNLSWGYANANSTKKKPIKQLYFEWEYGGMRGKTYVRSHLKEQVIALNEAKVPVTDILGLLVYNPKVKRVLGLN